MLCNKQWWGGVSGINDKAFIAHTSVVVGEAAPLISDWLTYTLNSWSWPTDLGWS